MYLHKKNVRYNILNVLSVILQNTFTAIEVGNGLGSIRKGKGRVNSVINLITCSF